MEQMRDPMILVLLGAAGLSLAASGGEEWLDAAIILVIVAVNSVISIFRRIGPSTPWRNCAGCPRPRPPFFGAAAR